MTLVLASSSAIRRAMLEAAGIEHQTEAPDVDEAALKADCGDPAALAVELAGAKAAAVSARRPDDWVIGSDSIVSVDGRMFDKPSDRGQAAEHLRLFSGRQMQLTSAVALARGGDVDWSHCQSATLAVRALSEEFIAGYLEREWPAVSNCVGVFRLEGPGVQLFESIEGDHFTVLGMPLLPLLGALRERGLVAA
ncbi:Maf family nucleotide pyrophosphatase [Sphingomonas sp.]|uniref:Maf family protein n=1 Tax=Sphingomonas sp. TaxID=28214 RepID=UPI0017FC6EA0|nr:Maf family nucleotide pyrophosphatase [Sphingomonas sp.]MBA3510438.1 septum formation protein Maf [Sphingomonas sp.]